MAIAGCSDDGDPGTTDSGDGDDGSDGDTSPNDELGERVPTLTNAFYGFGGVYEDLAGVVDQNINDFGFSVETEGGEITTVVEDVSNDARNFHMYITGWGPGPQRLDPHPFAIAASAVYAGANGRYGPPNWANCEFTDLVQESASAGDTETRQGLIDDAQELYSENYVSIDMLTYYDGGALRSDLIDPGTLGSIGISTYNTVLSHTSTPTEGDSITVAVNPEVTAKMAPHQHANTVAYIMWGSRPFSPIVGYNPDRELEGVIAEGWEIENGGERITVSLRDGQFSNGDPITAEDVRYTHQYLEDHRDAYTQVASQGYSSIEVVDDRTVAFNFEEPNPRWLTTHAPIWGIINKEHWQSIGGEDGPDNVDLTTENFVGSGPWEVTTFESGRQVTMEPNDGHPRYSGFDHTLNWVSYSDAQARVTALIEGEIEIAPGIPSGGLERIDQELGDDQGMTNVNDAFTTRFVQPQHTFGPGKFREFRYALGKAFNRQEMNAVGYNGLVEPVMDCHLYAPAHPWANNDVVSSFTDDPTGDMEGATQVLQEAGWGQDDDGNWHYPPDADLSPAWPEGETPPPDEFPCVDEEGNYAG